MKRTSLLSRYLSIAKMAQKLASQKYGTSVGTPKAISRQSLGFLAARQKDRFHADSRPSEVVA
jgi:hypothetical protein